MMRRIAQPFVGSLVIAAMSSSAAAGMIHSGPHVVQDLRALPEHPLSETVITKAPQAIDVTVAKLPAADAIAIIQWPPRWPAETLDPNAKIVIHFVSTASTAGGSSLEHRIAFPPLSAGLYQVRLKSPERTAVQDLNVGTLDAMINRGTDGAVLMAVDLRTMHRRTDAVVTAYAADGARRFAPSGDGLFHLPRSWPATGGFCSKDGGLVVSASDGSIVSFRPAPCRPQIGLGTYFDTDRPIYRPGDRVYYRIFSRHVATTAEVNAVANSTWFGNLIQSADHVATGSFVLPATGFDYWHPGAFVVSDSAHSRYQVEAASETPEVSGRTQARFVLSATLLDGTPAAGLNLRYAWHGVNGLPGRGVSLQTSAYGANGGGPNDLTYGDAVLDSLGNATVTVPVDTKDIELYVFDPDTKGLITDADAVVRNGRDTITIVEPFGEAGAGCFPIEARETLADGSPASGHRLRLEVQPGPHYGNAPSPPPALARELITDPDGYVITTWCARAASDFYEIVATDERPGGPSASAPVAVRSSGMVHNGVVLLSADTPQVRPGTTAALTAISTSDADALTFYGSGYDFDAQTTRFRDGQAHVKIEPPADLDDFKVGVSQPTQTGQQWGYADVAVMPKRHLLRVQLGCLAEKNYLCVRVLNWRGAEISARLFVDVTAATRAAILNAMARSDATYEALYTPQRPDYSFESSVSDSLDAPRTSYLYSLPSPRPVARPSSSPAPQPTPAPTPEPTKSFPSQTLLWLNGVLTDRAGYAKVSLPNLASHRLYLVHVIALGGHGEVGEAYTWTFRKSTHVAESRPR